MPMQSLRFRAKSALRKGRVGAVTPEHIVEFRSVAAPGAVGVVLFEAEAPGKFADTLLATGEFLVNQGKIPTAPTLETLRAGIATQLLQQAFGS